MADPPHDVDPGQHAAGRPPSNPPTPGHQPHRGRPATAIITDARSAASQDISLRIRRYSITMAFRLACFVGMVFVHGWLRWSLLAFAVILPYVAVVLANQADQRTRNGRVEQGAPQDVPQLLAGERIEVINGDVVEEPDARRTDGDPVAEPEGRVG